METFGTEKFLEDLEEFIGENEENSFNSDEEDENSEDDLNNLSKKDLLVQLRNLKYGLPTQIIEYQHSIDKVKKYQRYADNNEAIIRKLFLQIDKIKEIMEEKNKENGRAKIYIQSPITAHEFVKQAFDLQKQKELEKATSSSKHESHEHT